MWGQSYTYDGFGNLTAKTVTAGGGSNWSNMLREEENMRYELCLDTGRPDLYDPNRGDHRRLFDPEAEIR